MSALETLLAAIDAMRATCDRGSTHWDGCEAEHPRCAVYRAAEALRPSPSGLVTVTIGERVCRWIKVAGGWRGLCHPGEYAELTRIICPACGGRIVEVDG